MVFQQNLLEKAYFIAKMSGLAMIRRAGQFWLLESALKVVHFVNGQNLHVLRLRPFRNDVNGNFVSWFSKRDESEKWWIRGRMKIRQRSTW